MRTAIALLACCVAVLGVYVIANHTRTQKYRPVLEITGDPESHVENREMKMLAACPGVAFGFKGNGERTAHYYTLLMLWENSRWEGTLFQEAPAQEYLLWIGVNQDYDRLLGEACTRLLDENKYAWPEVNDANRYDLHDLRNGNIATSAILDQRTGRVWVWTSVTDSKGGRTKSEFVEEDLVPNPTK